MASFYPRYLELSNSNRTRAIITNADKAVLEFVNNGAAKIKAMEDTAAHMSERLFGLDEDQPKRRKLTIKSSEING